MVLLVLFIVLTSLTLFGLIFSIVKYRPLKTDNPNVNRHLKNQIQQIEEDKNLKRMEEIDARRAQFEITKKLHELKHKKEIKVSILPLWVIIIFACLSPVIPWYIYFNLGSPFIPDFPFEKRDAVMENFQKQINDMQAIQEEKFSEEILGMVSNLEARLKENPDDIEGWKKLGRAKLVLGKTIEAREAYANARKIDLYDIESLEGEATAALSSSDSKKPLPNDVISLFENLLNLKEDHALALLIVAEYKAKEGQIEKSLELFNKLLSIIPEGDDQKQLILDRMKELNVQN